MSQRNRVMKKYHVEIDCTNFYGTQIWEIEADSKEEALKKYNAGKGDIVETNVEVLDTRQPLLSEFYDSKE